MDEVSRRWTDECTAEHYARRRFRGRAAERDPKLVAALLAKRTVKGPILDVPCGAGRLRAGLEQHGQVIGLDYSRAMLAHADGAVVAGDARALPFADRSFGLVVACRLLHHLGDGEQLDRVTAELVRVSERWVVASFWDAASLPALRRRLGWTTPRDARRAISKDRLRASFERAGARVLCFRHSFRFVSQQCFALLERTP